MTEALEKHHGTVSIGGRTITNLRFADDIDGLAGDEVTGGTGRMLGYSLQKVWHGDKC